VNNELTRICKEVIVASNIPADVIYFIVNIENKILRPKENEVTEAEKISELRTS
jgi:hypothetical protein